MKKRYRKEYRKRVLMLKLLKHRGIIKSFKTRIISKDTIEVLIQPITTPRQIDIQIIIPDEATT